MIEPGKSAVVWNIDIDFGDSKINSQMNQFLQNWEDEKEEKRVTDLLKFLEDQSNGSS